MTLAFSEFREQVRGQRIAVVGIGISNKPLIKLLAREDVELTVFEQRAGADSEIQRFLEESRQEGLHFKCVLGANYLAQLSGFDLIFRAPSMHINHPALLSEHRRGAVITTEIELFMNCCPAPITAVTGSDGKTTTSTLVAELYRLHGYTTHLGGNVGWPLLDKLADINASDRVVLELSSFQLLGMQISPQTAVVTNVQANHLDVHGTFADYYQAKANIFRHQALLGRLILNGECENCANYALEAQAKLTWIGKRAFGVRPLFGLSADALYYQPTPTAPQEVLIERKDILLPGRYNALNYLTAAAVLAPELELAKFKQLAQSFTGVEHRFEYAGQVEGRRFYNVSIDSSPQRSIQTLSVLEERQEKAVLIMGGKDKLCDYAGLGRSIIAAATAVVLCGQNAPLIEANLRAEGSSSELSRLQLINCPNLAEAVKQAFAIAERGQSIVFTPAGTSFDQFANFNARGAAFKTYVADLTP